MWDILEIEKTKDEKEITNAYRTKLLIVHPEDDPQGFMELRRAYEEALEWAKKGEEEIEEENFGDDPVGLFMQRVSQIYNNFGDRNDLSKWKEILEMEVAQRLDTKTSVRESLLTYFLEHFFLPEDVPPMIGEHFNIKEDTAELENSFPVEFLEEFYGDEKGNGEIIPFKYLDAESGKVVDEYLKAYIDARNATMEQDFSKAEKILRKMEKMDIRTPFTFYAYANMCYAQNQFERALAYFDLMDEDEQEIKAFNYLKGDIYLEMDQVEDAEECFQREWEMYGEVYARFGIAKCAYKKGQYKEAREIILKEVSREMDDVIVESLLQDSVAAYIKETEEKLASGEIEEDQELIIDLSWSYYLATAYEKAIEFLNARTYDDEHERSFINILGRSYFEIGEYEKALPWIKRWVEIEEREEQGQYSKMLLMKIYEELDMDEELHRFSHDISTEDMESEIFLKLQVEKALETENYYFAIEVLNRLMDMVKNPAEVYFYRGKAFYKMGFLGEAYDDMEKVLERNPYELGAYMYKTEILIDAQETEEAGQIIKYLEDEGLDMFVIRYLKARLSENTENFETVQENYLKLAMEETDEEIPVEFYLNGAIVFINSFYASENKEYLEKAQEFVEDGLEYYKKDIALKTVQGDILMEMEKFEEARAIFEDVAAKSPYKIGIYGKLDNCCRSTGMWNEALEYATMQLEQAESGYSYMRRGQIYTCMHRMDEAIADFNKALELTPENPYIYNYAGVAYEFKGDITKALELYGESIKIGIEEGEVCKEAYTNLGVLLGKYSSVEQAAEILKRGYAISKDPEIIMDLIEQYRKSAIYDKALEELENYRKAKGLAKDDDEFLYELGKIYFEQGEIELAVQTYEKAMDTYPKATKNLAKIMYHCKEYAKALEVAELAVSLVEDGMADNDGPAFLKSDYYLWAAKIAIKCGEKQKAKVLAKKGLEFIPQSIDFRYNHCESLIWQSAGGLYVILEDFQEAKRCFDRIDDLKMCDGCLYPKCYEVYFERGEMYQFSGELKKALEEFKLGLDIAPYDTDLKYAMENLKEDI